MGGLCYIDFALYFWCCNLQQLQDAFQLITNLGHTSPRSTTPAYIRSRGPSLEAAHLTLIRGPFLHPPFRPFHTDPDGGRALTVIRLTTGSHTILISQSTSHKMLAQSFSHHHELSSNRMTTPMVVTPPIRTKQQMISPKPNTSRPKLSLNTSQARTFGKGSSLRLETLSAVSPTAINTFANGYEPERSKTTTSGRPVRPRLCIDSSVQTTPTGGDKVEVVDSRTPSSSSVSSASTLNSATIPYSMSQVLNSVLANSPLQPRANIRRMSMRPRFPAEKKVSFRTPLVEEIVNTKYTLAHSDISASDASDTGSSISLSSEDGTAHTSASHIPSSGAYLRSESTLSLEQPTDDSMTRSPLNTSVTSPLRRRRLPHRIKPKKASAQTGDKRDSSSESDSDACPETPVAGRRKRRREWVWTLGTLPGQTAAADNSTSSSTTSTSSSSTISTSTSDQSS